MKLLAWIDLVILITLALLPFLPAREAPVTWEPYDENLAEAEED